jgi:hypothetical protein
MSGNPIRLRLNPVRYTIGPIHSRLARDRSRNGLSPLLLIRSRQSKIRSFKIPFSINLSSIRQTPLPIRNGERMRAHPGLGLCGFINAVVDIHLVVTKGGRASVVDGRSTHIPFKLGLTFPIRRTMHHRTIIPDDQIPRTNPIDFENVLRLSSVIDQLPDELESLFLVHADDVRGVSGDVHGLCPVGVRLNHIVAGGGFILRFVFAGDVPRCGKGTRVPEGMLALQILDLILLGLGEVFVGGADVRKVSIPGAVIGDDMSEEERVRGTTLVE